MGGKLNQEILARSDLSADQIAVMELCDQGIGKVIRVDVSVVGSAVIIRFV